MLRAVPPMFGSQFPGVIVMGAAIVVMFFLPWLDNSPVKSIRYKDARTKIALAVFVVCFVVLGYLGVIASNPLYTMIAQGATLFYFGFFLYMPYYSRTEIRNSSLMTFGVLLYSAITLVVIAWWWNVGGEVSAMNKAIMTLLTLAYTAYLLIMPAFSKPAVVKPVPERVTF
jgi:hypothetical protein